MFNYLFNMNITPQPTPECNNGCPINKFPDGTTTTLTKSNVRSNNSFTNEDIVYSVYQTYQKTFTPMYIQNNLLQLTNPNNYLHYPMGPSNIFIIRHGETYYENFAEPLTNSNIYYNINCNGIYRSIHLPNFINDLGAQGFPITAIVTTSPNMNVLSTIGVPDTIQHANDDLSTRPQQTIFYSAWLLNIPLNIYSFSNFSQPYDATTAINIFTNPSFRGKNIIVSSEHDNAQALSNQLVQCYNYFKQGGTVQNLNNQTLYDVSTEEWWKQNTPISPQYQYPGFQNNQGIPPHSIPYQEYSQYLPYWNIKSFDIVFWLSQTNSQNNLTFKIINENISVCNKECHLMIGLIQYAFASNEPGWTNSYANDGNCLLPD